MDNQQFLTIKPVCLAYNGDSCEESNGRLKALKSVQTALSGVQAAQATQPGAVFAGNRVTLVSGRDTTLTGAQVSGESIKADVGRNLTLTSEQDSATYDAQQKNTSAGASFSFGSMSGSASINMSKDKMHSDYQSVQEQTGLLSGKGGFDVTVGGHTQLNGAVIGSTADADKNRLDTGTLGFSDIHNSAAFKTEHQSVGISTGGSIGSQFAGNMASGLLTGANNSGSADSTTKAAVSDGTIIIRDQNAQKQDVADLSRDVENANPGLGQIFDKEKEQNRLKEAQLIGEIGTQVGDIARTQGQIEASKAATDRMRDVTPEQLQMAKNDWSIANPGKTPTTDDISGQAYQNFYNQALRESVLGTGDKVQQAIQAATAAVQGLAGGDISKALAGGTAPYIANIIGSSGLDPAGKVLAHATVNAALAAAQGNNALVGVSGAATAEMVGMIALEAYGKPAGQLSETQKQTVSALATLAAGLASNMAGDSSADAVTGAQAGKTTVENNLFGGNEWAQGEKAREHGADVLSCADNPSGAACQRGIAENKAYAAALASGGLLYLPVGMQMTAGIGATANAGFQYMANEAINPTDVLIAGYVGAITANTGFLGTVGWNAAGGASSNYLKGDDSLSGAAWAAGGSAVGYGLGKYLIEAPLNKIFNPKINSLEWVDIGMGISKPLPIDTRSGVWGTISGSASAEGVAQTGPIVIEKIKKEEGLSK